MSDGCRGTGRLTFRGKATEGLNEFGEREIILSTDALSVVTAQDSDHRTEGILNEFANGFSRLSHERSRSETRKNRDTPIFVRLLLFSNLRTHTHGGTGIGCDPVQCSGDVLASADRIQNDKASKNV